ncbi:hypothetical protein SAMN05421876_101412 [Kaistella jeonii]|nr:hypothetical protein SAMN05421876_101412 [Kaistella jeonii]VEI94999.1 Uncharacterised protein [Kaistella jeonii]
MVRCFELNKTLDFKIESFNRTKKSREKISPDFEQSLFKLN